MIFFGAFSDAPFFVLVLRQHPVYIINKRLVYLFFYNIYSLKISLLKSLVHITKDLLYQYL